jgi:diaminopimelate epimerase
LNLNLKNDLKIDANLFSEFSILKIACISVGNPHLVIFLNEIPPLVKIAEIGEALSKNELFANGINVSFVKIISEDLIKQCSYERGSGLTLACGSGACATTFLANKCGLIKSNKVTVRQRGGDLSVVLNEDFVIPGEDRSISQTGPATYVFSGKIEV